MKCNARWIRLSLIGAAVSLFAMPSVALAQDFGRPIAFGIVAGASFPLGGFADVAGIGWHGGGLVQWDTPMFPIGLRAEGVYHKFGDEDEVDINRSTIAGTLNGVWMFPVTQPYAVRPYIIGGVGVYNERCEGVIGPPCPSRTHVGLNGGGGITVPLSGFSTIVEARFHFVLNSDAGDSNTSFIPISVGLLFR